MEDTSKFPQRVDDLKVGDRIIVVLKKENHLDRGYVRYVGELSGLKGTYYGIELDEPKGLHEGKSYFTCKEKHGTFFQITYLRLIGDENFDKAGYNAILKKEQAQRLAEQKEQKKESEQPKPAETAATPPKTPAPVATPAPTTKAEPEAPKQETPKNPDEADPVSTKTSATTAEVKPKLAEVKPKPAEVKPKPAEVVKPAPKPAEPQPQKPPAQPAEATSPAKTTPTATKQASEKPTTAEIPKFNIDFYEKKIKDLENSYLELNSKREKDNNTLKTKIRSLEEQLQKEKEKASKQNEFAFLEKELQRMEEKYNNMSTEYESLKYELEKTNQNLEEAKVRIQELELDKEEMMLQAELLAEDDAPLTESDVADLKKNLGLMKMAFSKLEERIIQDKEKYERKIEDLEIKLKSNDGVSSEKVKKMLAEKDLIIEDLKLRLDDSSGTNEYISNLTEQLIEARNKASESEDAVREIKKTLKLNDDLIEEYEDMNGLLSAELDIANEELKSIKEQNEILINEKKESESIIAKYREKMKLIQGEIDIIKSQSSEAPDQDKIKKIDQLIKNYTVCLQEKRGVIKRLIINEYKDIKDAKQNLKWNIIIKSIPGKLVSELESIAIDKFLGLLELSKKIELILNQLKANYLNNPLVVEDNIELVSYISATVCTLLAAKRNLEYLFDYGFGLEKFEDLKNLARAPIFGVLVSYEVLLDRMINEIREDSFSMKFNVKLLEDNNPKILEAVKTMSLDFKEVPSKESIELRYYSKLIELQSIVVSNYADNKKQAVESFKANLAKISSINSNVEIDQFWNFVQEERLRLKKNPPTADELAAMEDSKIFHINKFIHFHEVLEKIIEEINKGGSPSELVRGIEEEVNRFILTNAKKPKKRDDDEEYPFRLFGESGPWMEPVIFVRRKLEKFEELQQELIEKTEKIEEINRQCVEAGQKVENGYKVKATLENRIKDLEFKNQNIPIIENERVRAVEQTKILQADIDRLKKEMTNLEEKVKLGAMNQHHSTVQSNIISHIKKPETRQNLFAGPGAAGRQRNTKEDVQRVDISTTKNILSYERIIENLHNQLFKKEEENIFDNAKMMKEMPYFYRLYSKEKRKANEDNALDVEGREALSQLNTITQTVKNKVLSKKIIDITKTEETDPTRRLKILSQQLQEEECAIIREKEKAAGILERFQSKWIGTYANLPQETMVQSKLLSENSRNISEEKVVGLIRLQNLDETALKSLHDSSTRVLINKSELLLKKAVKI